MMANPPGTLLFDLDGTLVDSAGDLSGSLDTLMAEKDLSPIGIATGRQLIGHGIANLVRNALKLRGESEDEGDIAIDLARFMDIYASRLTRLTRPYPGVVETLEVLRAKAGAWVFAPTSGRNSLPASWKTLVFQGSSESYPDQTPLVLASLTHASFLKR